MNARKGLWKMRNGELIKIAEMSDEHLVSSINMMKRSAHGMHEADIESALDCLSYHGGEMAEMAIEHQVDQMYNESDEEYLEHNENYQELTEEADRRGLWQCMFIVDLDEL